MTTKEIIAQVFGFIGLILLQISFQIKSGKKLLLLQTLANLFFLFQYILLGAYTGLLAILVIIRNLIVAYRDNYKILQWKGWLYVILFFFVVITKLTWTGPLCLLLSFGVGICTIGYFYNSPLIFRTVNLFVSSPLCLVYNFLIGAYVGAINEAIMMINIIVSIKRFGWSNLSVNNSEKVSK